MRLSDKQIENIIADYEYGKSISEIAIVMNINRKTISHHIYNYENNIKKQKREGKKPKTSDEQQKKIVDMVTKNGNLTLTDIQDKIKNTSKISRSTISRILHKNNIIYGNVIIKPFLTEKHKEIRLKWAQKYLDYDWKNVIFSDETSIWLNTHSKKCWIEKNNRKIHHKKRHSKKFQIWGCITVDNYCVFQIFNENLKAPKYIKILDDSLKNFDKEMYTFQQDNSPIHTSKIAKEYFSGANINILEWPPYSPDLNPIENLWSVIKLRIQKIINYVSVDNFADIVEKIILRYDYEKINNMINSMPNRIQLVIENKGDTIDY